MSSSGTNTNHALIKKTYIATTLVKTRGTITQQLIKMTHFLSPTPFPPAEGRGDSRNRLFQQHFQVFITGKIRFNTQGVFSRLISLSVPRHFYQGCRSIASCSNPLHSNIHAIPYFLSGSFAIRDHLWSDLGIICGPGSFAVQGSFAGPYSPVPCRF